MSADNGIIIRQTDMDYEVFEYNASTGSEFYLRSYKNLEEALSYGTHYGTEYGVTFEENPT